MALLESHSSLLGLHPGSISLIPSPDDCKGDFGQSCLPRSGVCTMTFIHPGGTVWWILTHVRDPVTTTTGKMAAFPPAPRSPCPLLQLVTPPPWAPLTCSVTPLAPSRIVRAARRPCVPGFLHTPACGFTTRQCCCWFTPWVAKLQTVVQVWARHTVFSFARGGTCGFFPSVGTESKAAAGVQAPCPGPVWSHLISLRHISGLGLLTQRGECACANS